MIIASTEEVCSLWANESKVDARNFKWNLYFKGDTIFSYGKHYPLARHFRTPNGEHFVLMNVKRWSKTTSRHTTLVLNKLSAHIEVIKVPDILVKDYQAHVNNMNWFQKQINEQIRLMLDASWKKSIHINSLDEIIAIANKYSNAFDLKITFAIDKAIDMNLQREIANSSDKKIELQKQQREKYKQQLIEYRKSLQNKQFEDYKNLVSMWQLGANVTLPLKPIGLDDSIVLRIRGFCIETSIGITVTIEEAMKLLPYVRAGKEIIFPEVKFTDDDPELRIGQCSVRKITVEGDVYFNYFYIKRGEIERIAVFLGLWPNDQQPPNWYIAIFKATEPTSSPIKRISERKRRRSIRIIEDR